MKKMNRYTSANTSSAFQYNSVHLLLVIGMALCCCMSFKPNQAIDSLKLREFNSYKSQMPQDSSLTHPGIRFSLVGGESRIRHVERLPHRALLSFSLPQHPFERSVKLEYRIDLSPSGVPVFVALVKTGHVDPKFVQAVMLHVYRWRFSPVDKREQVLVHLHIPPAEPGL
jgi:hypothetical protein